MNRMTAAKFRRRLKGKRLLIFDFDGTLADTSPLHEAAFNAALAPWGILVDYPRIAGLRTQEAVSQVMARSGTDLREDELQWIAERKQSHARELVGNALQCFPGVDEFLRWVCPTFRLAMYTSGSKATVELALGRLGYTGLFDPLLCASDVVNPKPHPEGLMRILRLCSADRSDALVFEDSEVGIAAADAAGVDWVRVDADTFSCFRGVTD